MLKNTQINRAATKKIATALGDLNDQVVYVGGAVVSLYIDDPSADDVRPTKDLDLTMEIASIGELEALREELVMRGFIQSANDSVVCRFRYEDVLVDVMSTQEVGWAPGNQ
jgi:predicted nucleotidyltransferase